MWRRELICMAIISVCYSCPVCVLILAQVMCTYVIGTGIYMKIYHFLVHIPDNLVPVVIQIDYYSHPICVPMRVRSISSAHVPYMYWDIYENI